MKTEDRDIALNPAQYRKLGCDKFINLSELDLNDPDVFNTVYYKEIPVTNGPLEETVIVTFSPKYRDYQRKIREGQIERARKMITSDGKIKKNRKNPNDPSRFIETVHVTSDAEVAENIIKSGDNDHDKLMEMIDVENQQLVKMLDEEELTLDEKFKIMDRLDKLQDKVAEANKEMRMYRLKVAGGVLTVIGLGILSLATVLGGNSEVSKIGSNDDIV